MLRYHLPEGPAITTGRGVAAAILLISSNEKVTEM